MVHRLYSFSKGPHTVTICHNTTLTVKKTTESLDLNKSTSQSLLTYNAQVMQDILILNLLLQMSSKLMINSNRFEVMGIKHLTVYTQGSHPEKTFCIVIEPK